MLAFHYNTVASTNSRAAALAALNPETPLLVTAQKQSAGRGRTGRPWTSPIGGAWFSIAWPCKSSPASVSAMPVVVGLAVRDAICGALYNEQLSDQTPRESAGSVCFDGGTAEDIPLCGGDVQLKWPNDVLLNGAKVAGILCEQTLTPGRDQHTLILGVGINANVDPVSLGDDLRYPATSLMAAVGRRLDVPRLIQQCVSSIVMALDAYDRCGLTEQRIRRVNVALAWRDQMVNLRQGQRRLEGVFRGVDRDARLLLETEAGLQAFEAGEVESVRHAVCVAT